MSRTLAGEPLRERAPADFAALGHRDLRRQRRAASAPASRLIAPRQNSSRSDSTTEASATIHAATSSLRSAEPRPKTTASRTPLNARSAASTSAGFTFLPATLITSETRPDDAEAVAGSNQQIVRREGAARQPVVIRLREIAVAGCGGVNADSAHRASGSSSSICTPSIADPTKPCSIECRLAVVANAAAFRRAVERMNRQPEFCAELLRHRQRQRRAGRDTKPEIRQRRHVLHFAERLVEDRHAREDRRVRPREIVQHRARHAVLAQRERNASRDQRRDQVAKAVRMRDGNDAEVQVAIGDPHRRADLLAIREQLRAAEANRRAAPPSSRRLASEGPAPARPIRIVLVRAPASRAQRHHVINPPRDKPAAPHRAPARVIVRSSGNDNQSAAQTREQRRRPRGVISELHSNNGTGPKLAEPLSFQLHRLALNLVECAKNLAFPAISGGICAATYQRLAPRPQQRIGGGQAKRV